MPLDLDTNPDTNHARMTARHLHKLRMRPPHHLHALAVPPDRHPPRGHLDSLLRARTLERVEDPRAKRERGRRSEDEVERPRRGRGPRRVAGGIASVVE